MPALFDPLAKLATLGAYAHLETGPDGDPRITLTYARTSTVKGHRLAQALLTRYERLLILQLDVSPGAQPRTVQQLVAAGKIKVVDGRYKLAK